MLASFTYFFDLNILSRLFANGHIYKDSISIWHLKTLIIEISKVGALNV